MVGAMVSFLDTETNASLIDITDSDGVALPNPLYTGSDGRIRLDNGNGAPAVPCIEDGLSYKVVVARRTGVEPVYVGGILQNASELYEEPYIVFVVTASGAAGGSNSTVVGSIAEVRLADPDLGSVVCSGYYSAGDCPSRVYSWVVSQNPPADNALNILRNPDHSTGYWKMDEPDGGMWDVRIAGMQTSNTPAVNDQCLTRLLNIVNGSTTAVATVYFPKGEWLLDSGFVCGSLCLEKEANLKPADNSNNRTVTVAYLENRGGHFCATTENATTAKRVLPVLTGLLRTSWLKGTVAEFLTSAVLANLTEVDFDVVTYGGSADVSIQKKIVHNIQNMPVSVGTGNCILFDYTDGELYISHLRLGRFLITLNQGDIQYILTQSNTSMLDVHTQGISTPKIQVSGSGSFGTGISVTGNSSFFGNMSSSGNFTAQIVSAADKFVGTLYGDQVISTIANVKNHALSSDTTYAIRLTSAQQVSQKVLFAVLDLSVASGAAESGYTYTFEVRPAEGNLGMKFRISVNKNVFNRYVIPIIPIKDGNNWTIYSPVTGDNSVLVVTTTDSAE